MVLVSDDGVVSSVTHANLSVLSADHKDCFSTGTMRYISGHSQAQLATE